MKIFKYLLNNLILSVFGIYSINLILSNIGFIIPINYFSLGIVSILGFPGLIIDFILIVKYYG